MSEPEHEQTVDSPAQERFVTPRYRLARRLGAGGMGEVWLADDLELKRHVAVKQVRFDRALDPALIKRIERECLVHARIEPHGNVITLFDKVVHEDQIALIMEYFPGQSLRAWLDERAKRNEAVPLDWVVNIVLQALEGLAHVQAEGIVHRDLKPDNLMIAELNGRLRVKLMDFGVSRMLADEPGFTSMTRQGEGGPGTPLYMAPEQIDPQRFGPVSAQTDIYAMGIILYQMLAGEPPFKGTLSEILSAHVMQAPPALPDSLGDTPEALQAILQTALAKMPDERFASAEEFAAVLSEVDRELYRNQTIPARTTRVLSTASAARLPQAQTVVTPPRHGASTLTPESSGIQSQAAPHDTLSDAASLKKRWPLVAAGAAGLLVMGALATLGFTALTSDTNATAHTESATAQEEVLTAPEAETLEQAAPSPTTDADGNATSSAGSALAAMQAAPEDAREDAAATQSPNPAPEPPAVLSAASDPGLDFPTLLPLGLADDPMPQSSAESSLLALRTPDATEEDEAELHAAQDDGGGQGGAPEIYVVQPGDSLSRIAGRYGVAWEDIAWWNDLKTETLNVGQELYMSAPAGKGPRPADYQPPRAARPVVRQADAPSPSPAPPVADEPRVRIEFETDSRQSTIFGGGKQREDEEE